MSSPIDRRVSVCGAPLSAALHKNNAKMLARSALRSARSVPVATHARAFSSGEFFPGIPKIQVRAQTQPSTFAGFRPKCLWGRPTAYRFS